MKLIIYVVDQYDEGKSSLWNNLDQSPMTPHANVDQIVAPSPLFLGKDDSIISRRPLKKWRFSSLVNLLKWTHVTLFLLQQMIFSGFIVEFEYCSTYL